MLHAEAHPPRGGMGMLSRNILKLTYSEVASGGFGGSWKLATNNLHTSKFCWEGGGEGGKYQCPPPLYEPLITIMPKCTN